MNNYLSNIWVNLKRCPVLLLITLLLATLKQPINALPAIIKNNYSKGLMSSICQYANLVKIVSKNKSN